MARPRLFVDLAPMRASPAFRRLWLGYLVSQLGSQLTVVAVAYQVFLVTRSSFDVGLVSLVQLVPTLVASIFGGALADAIDRRRILLVLQVLMALCSVGLALNSSGGHPLLWPLFVLPAFIAGFSSMDNPTRTTVMMTAVGRDLFVQANSLRQLLMQTSLVAGPAVAGTMLAAFGTSVVYWVDVASFATSFVAVLSIAPVPPEGGGTQFGLRSVVEGLQFLRGRQALQASFVSDLNATILGMPTSLFPALGLVHFHGGARAVGFLYAAPGAGALMAAVLSGWTARIRRIGRAVVVAIAIWGIALTGFGLAPWFALALLLLGIAGAADVISATFRNSIVQFEAPDRLRGRLTSIQSAVVQSGPRLGNFEAGFVAGLSTPQISVVSGGLGSVVGIAIIARLMPQFLRYDHREHQPSPVTTYIDEPANDSGDASSETTQPRA